ncbi:unnamed protein product [Brachionus calyciflorus]|uniref:Uncharacterized protein n=1 Tax=Brachionus calyciflorus TaxID=104777 RepID=A0A814E434_9BILA|nr:unnamed protein product [Brachionus calyciflorus]
MDYLQTTFNSWVGSNLTHLANASGQTVRIIISGDILKIKKISKEGVEFDYNGVVSKFNINHRSFHKLERCKQYEYMTVQKEDGKVIVENYEIGANKSYIILNNEIVRQKYGSNNLFEDIYGQCH